MAIAKKKKKFFDVEIPILKKETQLYSFTPEELSGRIIKYDLTRILRGKNAILKLDVKIEQGKPTSSARELTILPTFLKKMVRKGTSYIEDSFQTECQNAKITIKPFLIARRKISKKVRKALRIKAHEELIEYVKNKPAEEIFKEVLKNQLQKPLSLKLKKIYPLSLCEIRNLKIEKLIETKTKKAKVEKKEIKEETEKDSSEKKESKKEDAPKEKRINL